ncbi:MAG: hypothetical protein JO033_20190 [Acidobacteriaceae bacterium]|nr:hypothetical protein [Acidobacteriaceae bacterium]
MPSEVRPTFKTVLARNDELRVGKLEGRTTKRMLRLILEPRMMARDAVEYRTGSLCTSAEKIFRLLLVLLEIGLIG